METGEEVEALREDVDKERKTHQVNFLYLRDKAFMLTVLIRLAEKAKKLLEGQVTRLNEQLEDTSKSKGKLEKAKRTWS
jgi:aspartyl/asparaginyl-tRNA synthetase